MSETPKTPDRNDGNVPPEDLTLARILADVDKESGRTPLPPPAAPYTPSQPAAPYTPPAAPPYVDPAQTGYVPPVYGAQYPYGQEQPMNYGQQMPGYQPYGYVQPHAIVNGVPVYYGRKYNSFLIHALLFVFTGGIGNVIYAGYIWHWNSTHGY